MRDRQQKIFHVYIMASKPRGVLYVGMTSDLAGRAWKHREHVLEGFTKRYWVDRLVYFERHDDASVAARRERAMKRWRRGWKIELVETHNPMWRDLFADVLRDDGFECGGAAVSEFAARPRIAAPEAQRPGTQGDDERLRKRRDDALVGEGGGSCG